jgi:UDP-glucose 4-epimerase
MRILVTGGAGYIGSVMTDVLVQIGHRDAEHRAVRLTLLDAMHEAGVRTIVFSSTSTSWRWTL